MSRERRVQMTVVGDCSVDAKTAVAGVFDRAAATYDAVGVDYFSVFGRRLVQLAGIRAGDTVLDVGCGRGASLWPAADDAGPTGRVVGIDLAPGMVAATAADARAMPTVLVLRADAEEPPAATASYDVVLAGLVLFFLPDPQAALRQWRRTLVPGGRLVLTTFAGDDERWKPVAEALEPYASRSDVRPARQGGGRPWDTEQGLSALLMAAGLRDVEHRVEPHVAAFDDDEAVWRWGWSHGQRAAWERVPDKDLPAAKRSVLAALAPVREEDGRFLLRVQVRYTVARA